MIRFASLAAATVCIFSLAALSGCASNRDDVSNSGAAEAVSSAKAGTVVDGKDGGIIFTREQDFIDYFGQDPTKVRVSPDQTDLSDDLNRFTSASGRNFEWAYLAPANVWVFADRDANTGTAVRLDPYLFDVIHNKDTSNAGYLLAPVLAWYDLHMAKVATSSATIAGANGGEIFFSEQDLLKAFPWDPMKIRITEDQADLSDNYNRFTGHDGRRYQWVYLASPNAWIVADRDANQATAAMLEPYCVDVIYNRDTTPTVYTYEAPIDVWFYQHASVSGAATPPPSTFGTVIPGPMGAHVFTSPVDMIRSFGYDPTVPRVTEDETQLSDDYDTFTPPGGAPMQWAYVGNDDAWVFVDPKVNTVTAALVQSYVNNEIVDKGDINDSGKSYAALLAWYDANVTK